MHKPSGLLVHRSPIDRQETRFALQTVRNQYGPPCVWRASAGQGHTSGILLFALSPEAGRTLSQAFEAQQVDKRYLATRGARLTDAQGEIDYPLSRQPDGLNPAVTPAPPQSAHSSYQRLATVELPVAVEHYPSSRYALLALTPRTGRRASSVNATSSTSTVRPSDATGRGPA
ncbi:MAG: pseudouridine synthase [Rivihabitans pingtungensis]